MFSFSAWSVLALQLFITLKAAAAAVNITNTPPTSSFWYENIAHNGISPFIANGDQWKVYRNIKDFGAFGDGVHDDTDAFVAAVNYGKI
ncbi:MAG: hypothetical protein Q9227_006647 [Pyrenula ochraceoflavens]